MNNIGLLGFDFDNPNKGCEALTYSFLSLLSKSFSSMNIVVFGDGKLGNVPQYFPQFSFEVIKVSLRSIKSIHNLKKAFSKLDYVFDVTYGDGFSDIYGKKWNIRTDFLKQLVIWSKTKLVLMPQTYGPFSSFILKRWASRIINKAFLVFSRDNNFENDLKLKTNRIISVTDMAFLLPYAKTEKNNIGKLRIGLNISSLLWDEGHKKGIVLKLNYKDFCRSLISILLKLNYEVHLIPHVIDLANYDSLENDYRSCKILHDEFPSTILSPAFKTPIEAKNYISCMDIFIGSRMHSTIASFSSNVVTIPIAYSKKFKGLFGQLKYPYIIDGTLEDNISALQRINNYLKDLNSLKSAQALGLKEVNALTDIFLNELSTRLKNYDK